jgi:Tol biopolymer transport system component
MHKIISVLIIAALIGCSSSRQKNAVDPKERNYQISQLKESLSIDPLNPETYLELGRHYLLQEDTLKALAALDSALLFRPDYVDALFLQGEVLFEKGLNTAAYKAFLILLDTDGSPAWSDRIAEIIGMKHPVRQITTGQFDSANPAYDPAGSRIVFQSNRNQNWDIVAMDLTSGEMVQMTSSPLHDESPVFVDESSILFTRQQSSDGRRRDIYLIDSNLNSERPLVVHPADDWYPSPIPGGGSLLFVSDRNINGNSHTKIMKYDLHAEQVLPILVRDIDYGSPGIESPGDRFLFTARSEDHFALFDARLNGKNVSRLSTRNIDFGAPKYSPAGKKVVFFSRVSKNYDLYELDLGTEQLTKLTANDGKNLSPSYSPDGTKVVFYSNRTGRYQIHELDLSQTYSSDDLINRLRATIADANFD